jgi:hypothetical protein
LKEKKEKIGAIFINNTNFRNFNLLEELCREIGSQVDIYTSIQSKIIILSKINFLRNKIIVVDKNKEIEVGDLNLSFLNLNSFLIGNLAVKINYLKDNFFFIEGIILSNLLSNSFFSSDSFLPQLHSFVEKKDNDNYLMTTCQGMH